MKKDGDIGAGMWNFEEGEEEKEKKVKKEEVEEIWTKHFRVGPPDDGMKADTSSELLMDEERGRSRVARLVQQTESDETSTIDADTSTGLSMADSVVAMSDVVDTKLDPSAVSCEAQ